MFTHRSRHQVTPRLILLLQSLVWRDCSKLNHRGPTEQRACHFVLLAGTISFSTWLFSLAVACDHLEHFFRYWVNSFWKYHWHQYLIHFVNLPTIFCWIEARWVSVKRVQPCNTLKMGPQHIEIKCLICWRQRIEFLSRFQLSRGLFPPCKVPETRSHSMTIFTYIHIF